jgi:hypothetical protein
MEKKRNGGWRATVLLIVWGLLIFTEVGIPDNDRRGHVSSMNMGALWKRVTLSQPAPSIMVHISFDSGEVGSVIQFQNTRCISWAWRMGVVVHEKE